MKKGCTVIFVIVAILWIIGSLLPDNKSESSDDTNEVRPERALATRLDNATFYNQENELHSSISFSSENTGWFGVATLTQLGCRFVYSYGLEGNKIILTYTGSDCGRPSTDKDFFYDESGDYIYTMVKGQKYIFR